MKKKWIFVTLITLIAVFFATAQVMASPAGGGSPFNPPTRTPGAQATVIALQGNSHGNPQGNGVGKPNGKPINYRGTIGAVDATSLTLTLNDGSSVIFVLNIDTIIRIPTLGKTATGSDLHTGSNVGVHAVDEAGTLIAKMVLVIPGKPVLMHRVGEVTAYTPGSSITIKATDGNTYTFVITTTTKILPEALVDQLAMGARVTIIMPRDVTGGIPTASGIVIHPAH
jgi:hypothetical protein